MAQEQHDKDVATEAAGANRTPLDVAVAIASYGDKAVTVVAVALACLLTVFSAYSIWDSLCIERDALPSDELMQYRPTYDGEKLSFDDVLMLNEDTVGWITIEDTTIDFPVTQGEDDLEYVNKDIYGRVGLTGTIYLSSANTPDFSDSYNLVYGHHVDNGGMFGDLDKFLDEEFFESQGAGLLMTPQGAYDFDAFGIVSTHAYDSIVYSVQGKQRASFPDLIDYVRDHAVNFDEEIANSVLGDPDSKILALSTCADDTTNGRIILFAKMTTHDGPLPERPAADDDVPFRSPVFTTAEVSHWSVINLICMLAGAVIIVPLRLLRRKARASLLDGDERQGPGSGPEQEQESDGTPSGSASDAAEVAGEATSTQMTRDSRRSGKRAGQTRSSGSRHPLVPTICTFASIALVIASIVVFALTENMLYPAWAADEWTPFMAILLVASTLLGSIV